MSLKSSQLVEGRPGPAVLSVKVVKPSISVAKNTETLSQVSNFSEDLFSILFACCHLFLNSDTYVFRASFWIVGKIVRMLLFSSNLASIIFDRFQSAILFLKILDSDSYSANPKPPEFTIIRAFSEIRSTVRRSRAADPLRVPAGGDSQWLAVKWWKWIFQTSYSWWISHFQR